MTIRNFRLLLTVSLVVGILGGGVDFAFPALVPEAFRHAQEANDAAMSTPQIYFLATLFVILVAMLLPCLYGLYMLRPWAPRLSLLVTLLTVFGALASGTYAQSGLAIAASYLASYLWGAVLVLACCTPFSTKFQRNDG